MLYTHRGSTSASASRNLRCNEIDMQPAMPNLQGASRSASQTDAADLHRNPLPDNPEIHHAHIMPNPKRQCAGALAAKLPSFAENLLVSTATIADPYL
jgi:hypothetical protein